MNPGQVVVLLEVLADQLPVGVDVDVSGLLDDPVIEVVPSETFVQVA